VVFAIEKFPDVMMEDRGLGEVAVAVASFGTGNSAA
jgi:hypothetical protein